MQKRLTITIDEKVYQGLHTVIGPRRISRFIEELVIPLVPKFYFGTQFLEKLRFDRRLGLLEAELLKQVRAQTGVWARELRLRLTPKGCCVIQWMHFRGLMAGSGVPEGSVLFQRLVGSAPLTALLENIFIGRIKSANQLKFYNCDFTACFF